MKTCIPKLIVKTIIKLEENLELTSWILVEYVTLSFANSQATIFQIAAGNCGQNALIQSFPVPQQYTIAAQPPAIFVRAWWTMSEMKTIVEMIDLPLKCMCNTGRFTLGPNQ